MRNFRTTVTDEIPPFGRNDGLLFETAPTDFRDNPAFQLYAG
ncbi:hypothetical protein [Viscerimonas tarda]